jgi:hypothetical protein
MWLTRDAATMRREGWDPRDITGTLGSMQAVFDRLPGDGYTVLVPGMFHPDFSDGRLLSPLLPSRGITGPIDGERARAILDAYALAFFERHLRGGHSELLAGPSRAFPEARFERRHGREVRSGRETASRAS